MDRWRWGTAGVSWAGKETRSNTEKPDGLKEDTEAGIVGTDGGGADGGDADAVMQMAVMQAEVRKHQMRIAAEKTLLSSSYYLKAEKVDCRMTWKAQSAGHLASQKRMKFLV